MNWKDAVKRALKKPLPPGGWPKDAPETKAPSAKEGAKKPTKTKGK